MTVAVTVLGMLRGAMLVAVAYAGLLVVGALGLWALEGTPQTPNGSHWDPASALLFVTTLLTTVGKDGHGDPWEIRDPGTPRTPGRSWTPVRSGTPRTPMRSGTPTSPRTHLRPS